MPVPYIFGTATSAIPLSQLDTNFATAITLGNTAVYLGNTTTTINALTLTNVTISSGTVSLTNATVTTANVTTGNITNMISSNVSITGGNISGVTMTLDSLDNTPVGATTPATGKFTTLTSTGTATLNTLNLTNALGTSYGGTGLTSFTANGVVYASGTGTLATGSALTFDGTNISTALGGSYYSANSNYGFGTPDSAGLQIFAASGDSIRFGSRSSGTFTEQMRLTSTGLGIGTSSPQEKLQVNGAILSTGTLSAVRTSAACLDFTSGNTRFISMGADASTKGGFIWYNSTNAAVTEGMRLDSSGNLGLGVTPSAWGIGKALQVNNGSLLGYLNRLYANANAYFDNTGTGKYIATDYATSYQQLNGQHQWFTAPSGTAGSAISFTQAMTLDASGRLLVGTTSASGSNYLQVNSDALISGLTVGKGAGAVSTNTAVGASALFGNTTGAYSTAIGYNTASSANTGEVTAVGALALNANTSGSGNSALGVFALGLTTTGSYNTAIGRSALYSNTTASNNTAVGYQAGYSNTTGTGNTFYGFTAGYSTTGGYNTFIGNSPNYGAGYLVTTGTKNTILGGYNGNQGGLDIRTSSNYIVLSDGDGNPRGIFDGSGNLLVGKTSLNDTVAGCQIAGSGATYPGRICATVANSTNITEGVVVYSSTAGAYRFYVDMTGTVHATSTSITAISDQSLKTNIKPLETGLAEVMKLQPRRYDWINGDGTNKVGFIAQEVEQVLPDLVAPFKYNEEETKLGLKMGDMIPTLVKAIQELKAEFDAYKAAHP